MKTKVNNNIKLKSGGGLVNDANEGLSVTDLPVVSGINLTNLPLAAVASDNLKQSADNEVIDYGRDPESSILAKSIRISKSGTVRLTVDTKYTVSSAYSSIEFRVNGVLLSSQASNSLTYVTKTYDVSVRIGDLVQIYTHNYSQGGRAVYVKNFRVYYDVIALSDQVLLD